MAKNSTIPPHTATAIVRQIRTLLKIRSFTCSIILSGKGCDPQSRDAPLTVQKSASSLPKEAHAAAVSVPETIDCCLNNDIGNTVHKCLQCTWNTDAEFHTQLQKVYV